MKKKVIISCAVTGAIHTPSMSEHLPVTADEVIEHSLEAHEAGAAILHLHARDENDGHPTQDPAEFQKFLPTIHKECNAVINITTGGGPQMTVEERMQPCMHFKPEVASLNMGSMNFGLFPMMKRHNQFQHEWEKDMLERSKHSLFKNTFQDIENIMTLGYENGTRFEFECYDVGHLYNLHYYHREGMLKAPYFIQFVMGIMGGIGADSDNLLHMKKTADKLFGEDYQWSVVGAGATQMRINATGAALGSHVRVGLEDSLWDGPGNLAKKNADQVKRVREILDGLSLEVATSDEAREILGLKGKDNTNIK
tara:strand:+ start:916 stop:1845 length:930 start_codon:yes stop_codon:yes gene_type:complete